MLTIPASKIPKLLRNGSPVAVASGYGLATGVIRETGGKLYACMAVEGGESFLPAVVKEGDPIELVVSDPTGAEHAKMYLAEKLGMDGSAGLLWCPVKRSAEDHGQSTPAHWALLGLTPDPDGISPARWCWVFTEESKESAEYHWARVRKSAWEGEGMVEDPFAPNGYTTVTGILGVSDVEALRLAVLAVAGVQA